MSRFWCWFVKITGFIPFWLVTRFKVYYEDKKVQSKKIKGKAIVMANHYSVFDFATMMYAFPSRTLRCVTAEVIFNKNKFMAWFLRKLGAIKVERESSDFAFVSNVVDLLNENQVIEIYPEARLPLENEKSPLKFFPSVSYISLYGNTPIIPVVTNGAYFKKKRLKVLIGKPIDVTAFYDHSLTEKENINNITNLLRERIIELTNELERK